MDLTVARRALVTSVCLSSVASVSPSPAAQSRAAQPQRAYEVTDLEGVWANNTITPFQRPTQFADRALLTDEEVATLKARAARLFDGSGDTAIGDGLFLTLLANPDTYRREGVGDYNQFWSDSDLVFERRTSLITDPADGRLPPLTPEARQREAVSADRVSADDPERRTLFERCLAYTPPLPGYLAARNNSYYQIIQASGYVVIHAEMLHEARIIPLDSRPHPPESIRFWTGVSRGRWEHGSLVIESTHFRPNLLTRIGASDRLRVTERLTRVDADTIEYQITVDDPKTWAEPWTAMVPWKRSTKPIFEYACHEGNRAMEGILRGARADEQRTEAGRK